jgi:hypothetical protein
MNSRKPKRKLHHMEYLNGVCKSLSREGGRREPEKQRERASERESERASEREREIERESKRERESTADEFEETVHGPRGARLPRVHSRRHAHPPPSLHLPW